MADQRIRRPHRKRLNGSDGRYTASPELLYNLVHIDEETGCHLWAGKPNHKGYGVICINYKRHLTHRLSYELHVGPIPEGMVVCHKCDTPACVNPAHLFLGTRTDNHADMVAKGRHQKGSRQWKAKVTEDDVRAIRAMSGTHREVANQFGLTPAAVKAIRHRVNWRHVA